MTDRPAQQRAQAWTMLCAASALAFLAAGCAVKPPTVVVEELLEPISMPQIRLPSAADLAAAKLARVALVSSRANAVGTAQIDSDTNDGDTDTNTNGGGGGADVASAFRAVENTVDAEERKRLLPLAMDLRNATLDDPIAYRDASRALKRRGNLDPRIRGRLDRTIANDPVRLARNRDFDGWHRLWARTFNTVSEPLGSSLISGFVLAPYQLGNSLLHYFAEFSNSEPLSVTGRQALVLRQEFLAAHPETALTETLERQVQSDLVKLEKTLAKRRLRAAERALDANEPRLALHQAETARAFLENHPQQNTELRGRVLKLEARAATAAAELARRRAAALESVAGRPDVKKAEYRLATRLFKGPIEPIEFAEATAEYKAAAGKHGKGKLEFLRALSLHEAGAETASRQRLTRLSESRRFDDPMTRHARTFEEDAWQNPYGAFRRLERGGRREELSWRLAGEWINRPRYPNLPAPLAYLIDTPTIAMTILMAPLRAVISPWTGGPDFGRGAALAGYRYLVRYPEGEDQSDVIDWLYKYETGQERWGRALRLADLIDDFDPEERKDLVEKTAESRLARVDRIDRRDSKSSMLEGVAREFPDSEGGQIAGLMARAEFKDASPQHIRITRDFLMENPSVAGRNGLGLNPKLLNEDPADGELHADGILLRGGRVLEILLIAEEGDDKTPAEPRVRRVSKERLARIAAALDEAVQRNSLVDTGARQAADASRDLYLERAGLGITETPDLRATAESNFVYQSLRERYGMVRGRDSLLPFDLVLRGNLGDFTLGAFPRWRPPRETPDAFLYR